MVNRGAGEGRRVRGRNRPGGRVKEKEREEREGRSDTHKPEKY